MASKGLVRRRVRYEPFFCSGIDNTSQGRKEPCNFLTSTRGALRSRLPRTREHRLALIWSVRCCAHTEAEKGAFMIGSRMLISPDITGARHCVHTLISRISSLMMTDRHLFIALTGLISESCP